MRPIKFRAWDKLQKKMRPRAVLSLGGGVSWATGDDPGGWDSFGENFDLMQFTGLLDKNGKEIYEGDVIQQVAVEEEYRHKVIFEAGCFRLQTYDRRTCPINSGHNWEVIGTIYEHPELFKGNKDKCECVVDPSDGPCGEHERGGEESK